MKIGRTKLLFYNITQRQRAVLNNSRKSRREGADERENSNFFF